MKKPIPVPPKGYKYIFRPWRKCPKTGNILWAKKHGLKAWPLLVAE